VFTLWHLFSRLGFTARRGRAAESCTTMHDYENFLNEFSFPLRDLSSIFRVVEFEVAGGRAAATAAAEAPTAAAASAAT